VLKRRSYDRHEMISFILPFLSFILNKRKWKSLKGRKSLSSHYCFHYYFLLLCILFSLKRNENKIKEENN